MINILVTLNTDYIPPLKVFLKSLFINNSDQKFSIYLLHSNIEQPEIDLLDFFIKTNGHLFFPIYIDPNLFKEAPVFRHYTSEMYYRLAAHKFLPNHIKRILYLDPDIVAINPISEFYMSDLTDTMFVAAEHEHTTKIVRPFNKLRLKTPEAKGYFNTGVLLMNLQLMREKVHLEDIYEFIEENKLLLFLPDQDILNGLYWKWIKPADGLRFNYDARHFELTRLIPSEKIDLQWIKDNTVFIHYCGKDKPWHEDYKGELGQFYKYYDQVDLDKKA